MRVFVRGNDFVVTDDIAAWARARMEAAVGQHERRLDAVDVRLRDLNGPRHGGPRDMECGVAVRLRPTGSVLVTESADDLYAAVSRAADRLKNAVGRRLARTNRRRGGDARYPSALE